MMTYKKLYHRIRESTGLDVLTENVLQTIIENCFADVTSRGYREFNELRYLSKRFITDTIYDKYFEKDRIPAQYSKEAIADKLDNDMLIYDWIMLNENYLTELADKDPKAHWICKKKGWLEESYIPNTELPKTSDASFEYLKEGLYRIKLPQDYRKTLHVKILVNNKIYLAHRVALTDERVNSITVGEVRNRIRSNFAYLDKDAIFYIKGDYMYIETRFRDKFVPEIRLGYDKRLIAPEQPNLKDYDKTTIEVRREFEDAIVLFGIFFLLQRYSKDTDRVQLALNNYKYYVEDLTYTLSYEDNYTDEDGIICLERV